VGEQLTFFPYWTRRLGEFTISDWQEWNFGEGPESWTVETQMRTPPLSDENMRFLERGCLEVVEVQNNTPWDAEIVFERTFDENPAIERNYDDPT